MRALPLTAAGVGLALSLLATAPAGAITMPTLTGVRQSADSLSLVEPVHCLNYVHRHSRGHDYSLGCGDDTQTIVPSPRIGSGGAASAGNLPRVTAPAAVGRPPGNYVNPNNPQDRSGSSNPQSMTQPRAINPQDMR